MSVEGPICVTGTQDKSQGFCTQDWKSTSIFKGPELGPLNIFFNVLSGNFC